MILLAIDSTFGDKDELTESDWISVLKPAHQYMFDRIFNLARQKLEETLNDPVPKLRLAKAFGITSWLRPAYVEYVMRADPPTVDEINSLGVDCVMKVVKAREKRLERVIEHRDAGWRKVHQQFAFVPPDLKSQGFQEEVRFLVGSIVDDLFGPEISGS